MDNITEKIVEAVRKTKQMHPLIHCLTNHITINDCANIILAAGAKPIMAEHIKEVEEITLKAKALVINIGNISDDRIASIFLSGNIAKQKGIPIIFDPVGVAGSNFRRELSREILLKLTPNIIRGNMSEIKALYGIETQRVGVDVAEDDITNDENIVNLADIVNGFAIKQRAVVVATGKTDIIADSDNVYFINNGVKMLSEVTGTGCMCTSLTGVYASCGDYMGAAIAGASVMGISGEIAKENCKGIGSFKAALLDSLYNISDEIIRQRSNIIEKQ